MSHVTPEKVHSGSDVGLQQIDAGDIIHLFMQQHAVQKYAGWYEEACSQRQCALEVFNHPLFVNAIISEQMAAVHPQALSFMAKSPKSKVNMAKATSPLTVTAAPSVASMRSQGSKAFWAAFRKLYSAADKATVSFIQRLVNARKRQLHRQASRKHGVSSRGKLLPDSAAITVQNSPPTSIPVAAPILQTGTMSDNTTNEGRAINRSLIEHFFNQQAKKDARDSNRGFSLSRTVVSGGGHADKSQGISGSIHFNKNVVRWKRTKTQDQQLQDRVIAFLDTALYEAFWKTTWYRAAVAKLSGVPEERMMPNSKLPVSHVWWTNEPDECHWHIDTNTVGAAFVFTPETYVGGDLLVMTEHGIIRHKFKAGEIVGGQWQLLPHCNSKVAKGEDRRSFVLYLDKRVLSSSYKVVNKTE